MVDQRRGLTRLIVYVVYCDSTSIFGFNHYMAAYYAMTTVRWWLVTHPGALTRITFVVHQKKDVDIYNALWGAIFPPARVD